MFILKNIKILYLRLRVKKQAQFRSRASIPENFGGVFII